MAGTNLTFEDIGRKLFYTRSNSFNNGIQWFTFGTILSKFSNYGLTTYWEDIGKEVHDIDFELDDVRFIDEQ